MATQTVTAEAQSPIARVSLRYAWVVFALTFGLLISDYMSRQVLNAVFPLLKAEWALTDTQLGSLSGIVALMVGLLTFPLSLLAEWIGRVRSIVAMAVLWSLATLGCALAQSFDQMLLARFFVGLGEAAYGSVGIAVVISVFPVHMRATLTGAFMAGGMAGSVLGMAVGGIFAAQFGWRAAFAVMAAFGLVLAIIYPFVVRQSRIGGGKPAAGSEPRPSYLKSLGSLVATRSVVSAYVGSGLQLFISGAMIVWMPSYLNRYHAMAPDKAAVTAAGLVLVSGTGMVLWGMISDRLSRHFKPRKATLAITLCLLCCGLLSVAFRMPSGSAQLLVIAAGLFVAAGTTGPSGAMVANLTHPAVHGAAFAALTLANNLLGLAPGPLVTGALADRMGLDAAFQLIPLISLPAALAFWVVRAHYGRDLAASEAGRQAP
ncbi:MFS transporter [Brevundimonas sp. Root1279]|uniref:MFS transporter n=1 Tax=Brevundimonas sp. Root1279 TaxID=1736443 RepID=UPI0006F8425C|nr:MFS transporter [Brevundimonas sp. Root1279]KQW82953.1 multidrug DMT transporter permease [Brevundimonas sp. Root1279]